MVDHTHAPAFVVVSTKDTTYRAHEIYVDRGSADGQEDWLGAEHELESPPGRVPFEWRAQMRNR